jgi:hypothetical protein
MKISILLVALAIAITVVSSQDLTTKTPCPFLNVLIEKDFKGRGTIGVEELVAAAKKRGINEDLMRTLANGRAEKDKTVIVQKLLDPTLFPAHRGSLAREDSILGQVDFTRLSLLKNYATNGRLSLSQLKAYQGYCWSLSSMGIKDKIPGEAELKLLWDLLGAYRDQSGTLDVNIVYNFLAYNTLPEPFKINTKDPSTIVGVILSLLTCGWWPWA